MASIFERIATGDEIALKECLDHFGPLVWALARRHSTSPADAEDAVQEIFISLWKSASRFDPSIASEATFIATIARRRLIDRSRARGRRPEADDSIATEALPAREGAAKLIAGLDLPRVERALAELRDDQRKVLELALVAGLTQTEIADQLGLALGTVKTHVRRGLLRVREALVPGKQETR